LLGRVGAGRGFFVGDSISAPVPPLAFPRLELIIPAAKQFRRSQVVARIATPLFPTSNNSTHSF
jgi:hypothetical protein